MTLFRRGVVWATAWAALLFAAALLAQAIYGPVEEPDSNPAGLLERGPYTVTRVIDGDTVNVERDGTVDTIRLIGIDTPELRGDECYATEAAEQMRRWLEGDQVTLLIDPTQGDDEHRDRYGRLLAYVVEGAYNVNGAAILNGLAREYTYDAAYEYQAAFERYEADAYAAGAGLWGACDGHPV